ncbi:FAD-dependent oxidoreductase [Candidatus Woesearchaeota archaeon]|nr:FAD-dependent oxidoreductase [Candidatus Woesearchaeota archaeon]
MMKPKVAIVGAGISGLVCAYELQKAGWDVEVFESNDYVGGRMATRWKKGFAFDIGADFFVRLYQKTRRYCEDLGIAFEPMLPGSYQTFKGGLLYPLRLDSLSSLLRYKQVSFMGRVRLLWFFLRARRMAHDMDFFDLSGIPGCLDEDDAYSIAVACMGKDVADYLVDGFTSTYQFHRASEISVGAMLALTALMSQDPDGFARYHSVGEMAAIPNALARHLMVHAGARVDAVMPSNGVVDIVVKGRSLRFDAVVIATTADVASRIIKSRSFSKFLAQVRYAPTVSLAFRVSHNALAGLASVTVPYVESSIIASYSNGAIKGQVVDRGAIVSVWLHESYVVKASRLSDKVLYAVVEEELRRVCPGLLDEKIVPHDLQRWAAAMPKFYAGYLTKVKEFLDRYQGEQNMYLCGDYLNSPWIEGSIRCGERVARQVASAVKKGGAQ